MKFLLYSFLSFLFLLSNESSCKQNSKDESSVEQQNVKDTKKDLLTNTTQSTNSTLLEKRETLAGQISPKLKEISKQFQIENSENPTAAIYAFDAEDNNTYFMFNLGMERDLPAYVLNYKGDTICITGGMRRFPNENSQPCPKAISNTKLYFWENSKK